MTNVLARPTFRYTTRDGDNDNPDQNRPLIVFNILLADTQGIPSQRRWWD